MGVVLSKSSVSEGRLLQVVEAHDGGVHCLSVNEDSTLLATGGQVQCRALPAYYAE